MKVPKPSHILHSLVDKGCLPLLSAQETEYTLKSAEGQEHGALPSRSCSTQVMSMMSHQPCDSKSQDNPFYHRSPFKIPLARCVPGYITSRTNVQPYQKTLPKLVNLSFSQPNSPRTPNFGTNHQFRLATPCITANLMTQRQGEQSVLNTPCVMGALHELQLAQDTGLPDMLAIIDDERSEVSEIEKQLLRNMEVELTDQTVVDYLLDVAQDDHAGSYAGPASGHLCQQAQPHLCYRDDNIGCVEQSEPGVLAESSTRTVVDDHSLLKVRRKRRHRHQKRMTAEEAMVIRRKGCGRPIRQVAAATRQFQTADRSATQNSVTLSQTQHGANKMAPYAAVVNDTASTCEPQQCQMSADSAKPSTSTGPVSALQASVTLRRSKRKRCQSSHFQVSW